MISDLKRDVIYDLDGSLSNAFDQKARTSATIVHGFPHIALSNPNLCPPAQTPSKWDGAVMCDSSATIRRVAFTNLDKRQNFASLAMKASELANLNDSVLTSLNETLYTSIYSRIDGTIM